MRFATPLQIALLTVATCLGLFSLDYSKNPQLWHRPTTPVRQTGDSTAHLALWLSDPCCVDCLDDVRAALAAVPGLDADSATAPEQLLTRAQADALSRPVPDTGYYVDVRISDLGKLDFVTLDRALREKGLIAGRIELSGVQHFRLEAAVSHLSSASCDRATEERLDFLKARGQGLQLTWLDSTTVDHARKQIVAYARFLAPGQSIDVSEFVAELNDVGYAPLALRAISGDGPAAAGQMSASSKSVP